MLAILTYLITASFIVLAIRVYKKPGIAATLVWSMIVVESVVQQGNNFLLSNASFVNYLVAGVAALAACWAILSGKYRDVKIPYQFYVYIALVGYCLISYYWSVSQLDTSENLKKQLPYILTFAILAPMCVYDEKQLQAAINVLICFGGLVVLGVFVSETGKRGIVLMTAGGKAVESNPLADASFAAYVAFACLFSIWGTKLLTLRSIGKAAILLVCIVVMIRSGSRGQLLAFAGVSIVLLPIMARAAAKRSTVLAMIAAAAVSFVIIMMIDQLGFAKRWDYQRLIDDGLGRFEMTNYILQKNVEAGPIAWIFGLGSSASFKYLGIYPHNIYGETLAEEGLVGFVLLGIILVPTLYNSIQLIRSESLSRRTRVNLSIALGILIFNIILGNKQGSLLGSASTVFCSALTLAWLNSRLMKERKKSNELGNERQQAQFRELFQGNYG